MILHFPYILHEEAGADGAGGGTAVAAPGVPYAATLQKQIDDLKAENNTLANTAKFWADKASNGAPRPAEKPAPAAAEEEVDVLDVIATKGLKGLDELMSKRGYVRQDAVDATVNARTTAVLKEQELMKEFPDLGNKESEFFKATANEFGELRKRGVPEIEAMDLAVALTDRKFILAGKKQTPNQIAEAKAAERKARAAAAGGDRGGGPSNDADSDEELTAEQRHICQSMGITEEAYKARAKKGVAMKGVR